MDYRKLIDLHIECEGLLRVLAERPADADALGLLRRRHAEIAAMLADSPAAAAAPDAAPDAAPAECAPAADEPDCIAVVAALPEEISSSADGSDEDIVIVLDSDDADEDASTTTLSFSAEESTVMEESAEAPKAAEAPARSVPAAAAAARPELRRCFTLNDKFRFIREIFGGSEREFADTLTLLADMASYAEAEDYICGDLALDREEPAVAEFLSIIEANMPASAPEKQP